MNRYKLRLYQKLRLGNKPDNWLKTLEKWPKITLDGGEPDCCAVQSCDITDDFMNEIVIREIEVLIDSDMSCYSNYIYDEENLIEMIMDNIQGHRKFPKWVDFISEAPDCTCWEEGIDEYDEDDDQGYTYDEDGNKLP